MNSMIQQWRLITEDSLGRKYRLFTIAIGYDKYKDRYLKVLFPDLKDVPMQHFHKPGGIEKSDVITGKFLPQFQGASTGLEYSFHFGSKETAHHFKDPSRSEKSYLQAEHRCDREFECLEILSVDVYDLSLNKLFTKKINAHDILLELFDGPTRFRIICIPNNKGYKISADQGPSNIVINHYSIDTKEFGFFVHIIQERLLNIPINSRGVAIYKQLLSDVDKTHKVHTKESFEALTNGIITIGQHGFSTPVEPSDSYLWFW